MLNYMVCDQISTLLDAHYDENSSYVCLERCCDALYRNREAILNIYDGDKAVLMNCLYSAANHLTELYTAKQNYSEWLPPEEYQLVVHIFKCCIIGLVEDCLNKRFDEQSCKILKAACKKLAYLPYEKD